MRLEVDSAGTERLLSFLAVPSAPKPTEPHAQLAIFARGRERRTPKRTKATRRCSGWRRAR